MIEALFRSLFFGMLAGLACLLAGYDIWAALACYSVAGIACLLGIPALHMLYDKAHETARARLRADDLTRSPS